MKPILLYSKYIHQKHQNISATPIEVLRKRVISLSSIMRERDFAVFLARLLGAGGGGIIVKVLVLPVCALHQPMKPKGIRSMLGVMAHTVFVFVSPKLVQIRMYILCLPKCVVMTKFLQRMHVEQFI